MQFQLETSYRNDLSYDSIRWEKENSFCRKSKVDSQIKKAVEKLQIENDQKLAKKLQDKYDQEYNQILVNEFWRIGDDSFSSSRSSSSVKSSGSNRSTSTIQSSISRKSGRSSRDNDSAYQSDDDDDDDDGHCNCCKCRKRLAKKWRESSSTPKTNNPLLSTKQMKELSKKLEEDDTLEFHDSVQVESLLKLVKSLQPVSESNIKKKWLAEVISDLLDGNFSQALARFNTCSVKDLTDTFSDVYQVIKNSVNTVVVKPVKSIINFLFGFLFEMF